MARKQQKSIVVGRYAILRGRVFSKAEMHLQLVITKDSRGRYRWELIDPWVEGTCVVARGSGSYISKQSCITTAEVVMDKLDLSLRKFELQT